MKLKKEIEKLQGKSNEETEIGNLPISLLGAFLGMLVGLLPIIISIVWRGSANGMIFIVIPLCVHYGIVFLKGFRGKRAFPIMLVFSLIGGILGGLICLAADFAAGNSIPLTKIPLIMWLYLCEPAAIMEDIKWSAVYGIIFFVFGIFAMREIELKPGPAASDKKEKSDDNDASPSDIKGRDDSSAENE